MKHLVFTAADAAAYFSGIAPSMRAVKKANCLAFLGSEPEAMCFSTADGKSLGFAQMSVMKQ